MPSAGNKRPRAFRLPADRALINRMGLNNDGAQVIARRIALLRERRCPLGINLAKTHDPRILGPRAIADFCDSFRRLAPLCDYVTLNISCPNTAEGKTFEEPESLSPLLEAIFFLRVQVAPAVPVLVKLSPLPPDGRVDELLQVMLAYGVAGLVLSNTAADRQGLRTDAAALRRIGPGGMSGRPLSHRTTRLISYVFRKTLGTLPIIGVGGVDSAQAAYEKIRAGARLVQVYTGLVYEGPGLIGRINRGLLHLLSRDGYPDLGAAVGADA